MRRTWLRGQENVHKRYLIHVVGFNPGLLMHALFSRGTLKEAADAQQGMLFVIQADDARPIVAASIIDGQRRAVKVRLASLLPIGAGFRHSTAGRAKICYTALIRSSIWDRTYPPFLIRLGFDG